MENYCSEGGPDNGPMSAPDMERMYLTLGNLEGPPYSWKEVAAMVGRKRCTPKRLKDNYRNYKRFHGITTLEQYLIYRDEKIFGRPEYEPEIPPLPRLPPREPQDRILEAWKLMVPLVETWCALGDRAMKTYLDPYSQLADEEFTNLFAGMKKRLSKQDRGRLGDPRNWLEWRKDPNKTMSRIKDEFGEQFDWSRIPNNNTAPSARKTEISVLDEKFSDTINELLEIDDLEHTLEEAECKSAMLLKRKRKSWDNTQNLKKPKRPLIFLRTTQTPLSHEEWTALQRKGTLNSNRKLMLLEWKLMLTNRPKLDVSALTDDEWKMLAKDSGITTGKDGKGIREEFYSIAVPNMKQIIDDKQIPAVAKSVFQLNLSDYSQNAIIAIYHSTTKATISCAKDAIVDLQLKGFLSQNRSPKSWQDEFFRQVKLGFTQKTGPEFFNTSVEDFDKTFVSFGHDLNAAAALNL